MTQRVSDEHVQKILLAARAEIATLRAKLAAVCEAGSATQKAFEEQAECGDCDAKAEALAGAVEAFLEHGNVEVCIGNHNTFCGCGDSSLVAALAAWREGK